MTITRANVVLPRARALQVAADAGIVAAAQVLDTPGGTRAEAFDAAWQAMARAIETDTPTFLPPNARAVFAAALDALGTARVSRMVAGAIEAGADKISALAGVARLDSTSPARRAAVAPMIIQQAFDFGCTAAEIRGAMSPSVWDDVQMFVTSALPRAFIESLPAASSDGINNLLPVLRQAAAKSAAEAAAGTEPTAHNNAVAHLNARAELMERVLELRSQVKALGLPAPIAETWVRVAFLALHDIPEARVELAHTADGTAFPKLTIGGEWLVASVDDKDLMLSGSAKARATMSEGLAQWGVRYTEGRGGNGDIHLFVEPAAGVPRTLAGAIEAAADKISALAALVDLPADAVRAAASVERALNFGCSAAEIRGAVSERVWDDVKMFVSATPSREFIAGLPGMSTDRIREQQQVLAERAESYSTQAKAAPTATANAVAHVKAQVQAMEQLLDLRSQVKALNLPKPVAATWVRVAFMALQDVPGARVEQATADGKTFPKLTIGGEWLVAVDDDGDLMLRASAETVAKISKDASQWAGAQYLY